MWSYVALLVTVFALPIAGAHRAVAIGNWRAFVVCFHALVLPLIVLIPLWFPLRSEALVGITLGLGVYDAYGARLLYERYLVPLFEPLDALVDRLRAEGVEGVLSSVERAWRPTSESPTPGVAEEEDGSDDQ